MLSIYNRDLNNNEQTEILNFTTFFKQDEIHCYFIDLKAENEKFPLLFSLLSEQEKYRAGKFLMRADQERYVYAHGYLRLLISKYTGKEPFKIEVLEHTNKKPYIADCPIKFNISHAGSHVLLGFSKTEIGVDIEYINYNIDYLSITHNYFAEKEIINIKNSNNPALLFFKYWTRKEAFLKAIGIGLDFDLSLLDMSELCLNINIDSSDIEGNIYQVSGLFKDEYFYSIASVSPLKIRFFNIERGNLLI